MIEQAFAILLASAFTFGCAAIYKMRVYTREMTGILFRVALCLAPFLALLAVTQQREGDGLGGTAPSVAHRALS
jgi:hypothetical protein